MYSLSTSWNSSRHTNGFDLIDEIKAVGFDSVELNFALTEDVVRDVLSLVGEGAVKVSSLHNMCPLPKEIEPDEASPDYYSLASLDDDERSLAVEVAKNTILYAARLGAAAVVLHAGRVQMKDRTRDLAALLGDKVRFRELKEAMLKERAGKRSGYLASVTRSLAELVPFAVGMRISLGIENRYYYREIPLIEELEEMFSHFPPGELFYWHDTGHARVFENLGLAKHLDFLERFKSRLLGVHLHDIIGPMGDHKAPGAGDLDFRIIKPYLKADTIRVIEVHQPATAEDIRRGLERLQDVLG